MKIIPIFLILIASALGEAKEVELGVYLGANLTNFNWFTAAPGNQFVTGGYGAMGGLSLSIFQYKRFGFRLAALDYMVNQSATSLGQTVNISGSAPLGLVSADVNFDLGTNRHSFGVGYGYESLSSISYSGTGSHPISTSAGGLALDAKDFWKNGWFDYAVLFFPHDNLNAFYSIYTITLGIGYDFGGKD